MRPWKGSSRQSTIRADCCCERAVAIDDASRSRTSSPPAPSRGRSINASRLPGRTQLIVRDYAAQRRLRVVAASATHHRIMRYGIQPQAIELRALLINQVVLLSAKHPIIFITKEPAETRLTRQALQRFEVSGSTARRKQDFGHHGIVGYGINIEPQHDHGAVFMLDHFRPCLLYTSPSPRDGLLPR